MCGALELPVARACYRRDSGRLPSCHASRPIGAAANVAAAPAVLQELQREVLDHHADRLSAAQADGRAAVADLVLR